ncbi:MAG: phage protein Gp36 family protein [Pseudomonadota bacterium]
MYATQQDLVTRYGESELETYAFDDDLDQIDTARVDQALQDASNFIDAYLAAQMTVPVDPAPDILTRLCAEIARYRLQDDQPLDEARKRYEDAVALLKDIARGTASLDPSGATAASTTVHAMRDADDRTFTRESLDDF